MIMKEVLFQKKKCRKRVKAYSTSNSKCICGTDAMIRCMVRALVKYYEKHTLKKKHSISRSEEQKRTFFTVNGVA